ncbi:YbaK/EbsC family protein [Paracoccaceae bacterium Fryx2]|nr:YbaK/EbsC family protein [Paracoccaceae bacterium Fryx2]
MSKSLKRVRAALEAAGVEVDLREMATETRTARQAADAAGCALDQIVKSILFRGESSGRLRLFLTAGGNQICASLAAALAGEPLGPAEAAQIRAETGFAIGGVAPVGHLTAPPVWIDRRLLTFPLVWAAAGTPRHIFAIPPQVLHRITGAEAADFVA